MKIPNFIKSNVLLKITSVNALVIGVRLVVSFFIQRMLALWVGEAGIYKIGQLRSLTQMLTSVTSLGVFNGVVKYVAEHKENKEQLQKLFSTTTVFLVIGSFVSSAVLLLFSNTISEALFSSKSFSYLIKLVAVVVPFIGVQRVFNGVVNGLSEYKKFAKIELISYLLGAGLTIYFLYTYNIDGALVAIAVTPVIQVLVMLGLFLKVFKEYVQFNKITFTTPLAKSLLAFTLMSFVSTVFQNFVEMDIRSMLAEKLSEEASGIWTAMTFISKNYMVFSGAIFTLYVLPKFAAIHTKELFKKELFSIYKTILPIFAIGMILVYFLRSILVDLIYPGFTEMLPLFKWQLIGDFVRLASLVLMHQFLAKKLVRNFVFTEVVSLISFYILTHWFVSIYGVEGVVMAHVVRYLLYFLIVFYLINRYYDKTNQPVLNE